MKERGILTVVSGFSGAGKGTIVNLLVKEYEGYALSVSATTRKPREGEIDGVHYFYVSEEEFEQMIEQNELVEYAKYVNNYYGTPRKWVAEQLDAGKDVILEIEVQGALQIKKKFPKTVLVFVTAPTIAELTKRLRGRGTETEEQIQGRLNRAREEVEYMEQYDFILSVHDPVTGARCLHEIIDASHSRPVNCQGLIDELREELEKKEVIES